MRIFVRIFLVFLFCAAVFAAWTEYTDADMFDQEVIAPHTLKATTLDFSSLDSATQTDKSLLFSIVGMKAPGFQVGSIRIKKVGEEPVPFTITAQQTSGDTVLCSALQLTILKDWKKIYEGSVLNTQVSEQVSTQTPTTDFVFAVTLQDAQNELVNKSCAFTFVFQTTKNAGEKFSDIELVQNTITTGTWTNE